MEMDMESLECPVCGEDIHLKSLPRKNDTLTCPLCDETLWVVSKSPLRLQRVIDKWDDEDEDGTDERREGPQDGAEPLRQRLRYCLHLSLSFSLDCLLTVRAAREDRPFFLYVTAAGGRSSRPTGRRGPPR